MAHPTTIDANEVFRDVVNNPGTALANTTDAYSDVGVPLGLWVGVILLFFILVVFFVGMAKGFITKKR